MVKGLDFKTYVADLEEKGYRCSYYGDTSNHNGLAYYETESHVLKIEYAWNKVKDNHYVAGDILNIEDVTTCYR